MKSDNYKLEEIVFDAPPVASTEAPTPVPPEAAHAGDVAWPYIVFSVLLLLSLIGIALKILRNQKK